jgi:hypothetical protein
LSRDAIELAHPKEFLMERIRNNCKHLVCIMSALIALSFITLGCEYEMDMGDTPPPEFTEDTELPAQMGRLGRPYRMFWCVDGGCDPMAFPRFGGGDLILNGEEVDVYGEMDTIDSAAVSPGEAEFHMLTDGGPVTVYFDEIVTNLWTVGFEYYTIELGDQAVYNYDEYTMVTLFDFQDVLDETYGYIVGELPMDPVTGIVIVTGVVTTGIACIVGVPLYITIESSIFSGTLGCNAPG